MWKIVFALFTTLSASGYAGQGEPNCKLSLQVLYETGKKRLDITEIYAFDREDCKLSAYEKRTAEMTKEDVIKVKVFFAYDGRRRAN